MKKTILLITLISITFAGLCGVKYSKMVVKIGWALDMDCNYFYDFNSSKIIVNCVDINLIKCVDSINIDNKMKDIFLKVGRYVEKRKKNNDKYSSTLSCAIVQISLYTLDGMEYNYLIYNLPKIIRYRFNTKVNKKILYLYKYLESLRCL